MRDAFVSEIERIASQDEDFILVTADLGFGIFDQFRQSFPGQFLNVGIAEQNMAGIGAGLALEGRKVVLYSIANFSTLRCLEQIRNDIAYHGANVTIVCSGGGFSYGALGMSHHATEDLAITRALPGLCVVAPCSAWEASHATRALYERNGPGYLRLEKGGDENPHFEGAQFEIGKAFTFGKGTDVSIIVTGGILEEVLQAVQLLEEVGISALVVAMHTIKPFDEEAVLTAAKTTGRLVIVEEHNVIGGLGGAVAEALLKNNVNVRTQHLGLNDTYSSIVGDQKYLREVYGMDSSSIYQAAVTLVNNQ